MISKAETVHYGIALGYLLIAKDNKSFMSAFSDLARSAVEPYVSQAEKNQEQVTRYFQTNYLSSQQERILETLSDIHFSWIKICLQQESILARKIILSSISALKKNEHISQIEIVALKTFFQVYFPKKNISGDQECDDLSLALVQILKSDCLRDKFFDDLGSEILQGLALSLNYQRFKKFCLKKGLRLSSEKSSKEFLFDKSLKSFFIKTLIKEQSISTTTLALTALSAYLQSLKSKDINDCAWILPHKYGSLILKYSQQCGVELSLETIKVLKGHIKQSLRDCLKNTYQSLFG